MAEHMSEVAAAVAFLGITLSDIALGVIGAAVVVIIMSIILLWTKVATISNETTELDSRMKRLSGQVEGLRETLKDGDQ